MPHAPDVLRSIEERYENFKEIQKIYLMTSLTAHLQLKPLRIARLKALRRSSQRISKLEKGKTTLKKYKIYIS